MGYYSGEYVSPNYKHLKTFMYETKIPTLSHTTLYEPLLCINLGGISETTMITKQ